MFDKLKATMSLAASLVVLLSACSPEPIQEQVATIPTVKIIDVGGSKKTSLRQFPAEVEANRDSHLAFRVSGELEQFAVKAGNQVKKGQLLARLDPTDFEIQLSDRQARHALTKAQFARAEQLLERKLTSQAQFDQAQANLLVAQSNLNSAQTALDYTTLRAPYDGVIARVFAENLQNVRAQQVILDMQNRDSIDISIQVPERLIANLDKDTSYQPLVVFDFAPEQQHLLTIKEWDAQADLLTRTYKIVFTMPLPPGANILPGMTGTVLVDLSKVTKTNVNQLPRFVLPVAAVFAAEDMPVSDTKRYLWQVLSDMSIKRIAVEVGEISGQGIEILSGLSGGEQIVGAGVHFIREGMIVRRWTRERGL